MDINELREKFLEILRKDDRDYTEIAKEIGISHDTFKAFAEGKRHTNLKSFLKIEQWIRNEVD